MLICVLPLLFVVVNVVARPVVAKCWVHRAVPKSAICQIAVMSVVLTCSEMKVYYGKGTTAILLWARVA